MIVMCRSIVLLGENLIGNRADYTQILIRVIINLIKFIPGSAPDRLAIDNHLH